MANNRKAQRDLDGLVSAIDAIRKDCEEAGETVRELRIEGLSFKADTEITICVDVIWEGASCEKCGSTGTTHYYDEYRIREVLLKHG